MFVNIVSHCMLSFSFDRSRIYYYCSVILLMFMMQNFDDDNALTKLTYM